MGYLKQGKWHDQWYDTKKEKGHFKRQTSSFRDFIGQSQFPAQKGRYQLIVSHACPWAHRCVIFRELKALHDYVGLSVVDPIMLEHGWEFKQKQAPIQAMNYLYELYLKADPHYQGRVTVPVLWDLELNQIVNNESSEIIRMFNKAFNHLTHQTSDFYPKHLQTEINTHNQRIYNGINNGVYKVGFSTSQSVYETELKQLFETLDFYENHLKQQRYLCGNELTEADWRLFTTLIRFDAVYVGHFKCNIKRIQDYPHLQGYLKDLYQHKGIKQTVHFKDIKTHYYVSHPMINPTQIIPQGPELDLDSPHQREQLT